MIGLIVTFLVFKYFYELAQDYYKHRWIYGFVGLIVYHFSVVIYYIIIGLSDSELKFHFSFYQILELNLSGIVVGILGALVVYYILKGKWRTEVLANKDQIKDIGK